MVSTGPYQQNGNYEHPTTHFESVI